MTVELLEKLSVRDIANTLGCSAEPLPDKCVCLVTTDSRMVKDGALFIAIKGEHFDGNDFIDAAIDSGAVCVICERPFESKDANVAVFTVDDSIKALGRLAAEYKARLEMLTVAVTGSIGKTTTKEFIYSVLAEKYAAVKTEGNHNNNIGLPMTLLGFSNKSDAAVIEMGMSHSGEISELSRIARPDIAVITNIGTSHIGNLGSREAIRDAKLEILMGLRPGGAVILNGDEPLLSGIEGACYVSMHNKDADVYVDNTVLTENGSAFDLTINGETIESVVIPALGEHNIMNAAMAYAVGLYAGMGEFEIRRGLKNYHTVGMRQNLVEKDDRLIIEDCYNASPESVHAALSVLRSLADAKESRSIAVLGEIRELGDYSESFHRSVGVDVVRSNAKMLFTFGHDAALIADEAVKCGMNERAVFVFEDIDDPAALADALREKTGKGDILLFKASRALKLERVIELL